MRLNEVENEVDGQGGGSDREGVGRHKLCA